MTCVLAWTARGTFEQGSDFPKAQIESCDTHPQLCCVGEPLKGYGSSNYRGQFKPQDEAVKECSGS